MLKTRTDRPIAKLRSTGIALSIGAFLPLLNVILAKLGLPSVETVDPAADGGGGATGLVVSAYTGVVAWVRGYLRRPDAEGEPVVDKSVAARCGYALIQLLLLSAAAVQAQPSQDYPDLRLAPPSEIPKLSRGPSPEAEAVFYMSDFGVVADSSVNNTPALQRTYNAAVADALAEGRPGRHVWTRVVPPCGVIGYEGMVKIRGAWIVTSGCGGAVVSDQVDDPPAGGGASGGGGGPDPGPITFRPVREVREFGREETRFRLLDNAVGRAAVNNWTVTNLGSRRTTGRGSYSPDRSVVRFEDLVLDGNWRGNLEAFKAVPQNRIKSRFQDSPSWTGITAGDHGGYQMCMADGTPARVDVVRASVRGYGATGILGGGNRGPFRASAGPDRVSLAASCTDFRFDQLLTGDVLWNHTLYLGTGGPASPTWPADSLRDATYGLAPAGGYDVTLTGFSWTYIVSTNDSYYRNLVFERWADSPGRDYDGTVVNVRAGYFTVDGGYFDTRDSSATDSGAKDGIRLVMDQMRASSVTAEHVVWRTGLADIVLKGGGHGSHWTDVRVYPERGLKSLVNAAPTRVGADRSGVIDLAQWQVSTPPAVGRVLVSTKAGRTIVNISDSRLEGFEAPLSANAVGGRAAVNITDTEAPPFARGRPTLHD